MCLIMFYCMSWFNVFTSPSKHFIRSNFIPLVTSLLFCVILWSIGFTFPLEKVTFLVCRNMAQTTNQPKQSVRIITCNNHILCHKFHLWPHWHSRHPFKGRLDFLILHFVKNGSLNLVCLLALIADVVMLFLDPWQLNCAFLFSS